MTAQCPDLTDRLEALCLGSDAGDEFDVEAWLGFPAASSDDGRAPVSHDELVTRHPLFLSLVEHLAQLRRRAAEPTAAAALLGGPEADAFGCDPDLSAALASADSRLSELLLHVEQLAQQAPDELRWRQRAKSPHSVKHLMLTAEQTAQLRAFFVGANHERPTAEQKRQLIEQTGLDIKRINQWFVNARRRLVYLKTVQSANTSDDEEIT